MIDPQDQELENIIKSLMQLKESGFKGKMIIFVREGMICGNCEVLTEVDLTKK